MPQLRPLGNAVIVDKGAIATAKVFDHVVIFDAAELCVTPRDADVGNHGIALGIPTDHHFSTMQPKLAGTFDLANCSGGTSNDNQPGRASGTGPFGSAVLASVRETRARVQPHDDPSRLR